MALDPVVVSRHLEPVTTEAIARLEQELAIELPTGYAEVVTALGEGTFCGVLNVHCPDRIRTSIEDDREVWSGYWFWDEGVLTRQRASQGVTIGDSIGREHNIPDAGRRRAPQPARTLWRWRAVRPLRV